MIRTQIKRIAKLSEEQYQELMNNGSIVIDGKTLKKEDYPLVFTPDGDKLYKHSIAIRIGTSSNIYTRYRFDAITSYADSYAVPETRINATLKIYLSTIVENIPKGYFAGSYDKQWEEGAFMSEHAGGVVYSATNGVAFYGTNHDGIAVFDGRYLSTAPDDTYVTITDTVGEM